jgi:hypothetical protein
MASAIFPILLVAAPCGVRSAVDSRGLDLAWNVPVTDPRGSLLNWYEMKADPEDGENLIVCGTKRSVEENAYYGVVYASRDGGRSWRDAFEDHSSSWVTEHSCAFGRRHVAYFVSEASKVVDGVPHHALGTTRIFRSPDGGETWIETAKTGWADFSTSVVASTSEGSDQKLYVFYNGGFEFSPAKKNGSTLKFFTVSGDGRKVSDRQSVPEMKARSYQGVYPSASAVLDDGTPVVLYEGRTSASAENGTIPLEIGVLRVTPGQALRPIVIAKPSLGTDPPACPPSLSDSLAYDRFRQRLYVAYNDVVSGRCSLMLASSSNGGQSWDPAHELSIDGSSQVPRYFPILAVNPDGVLGVLWRGKREYTPDCWYFSISRDGLRLEETVSLSPCAKLDSLEQQSSGYLATMTRQPTASGPASVEILSFRDFQSRVGIAASPDGVLHPLWSTTGDGFGELRTARIQIAEMLRDHGPPTVSASSLLEVTDRVDVLYGGGQRLDRETKSVTVDICVRNHSSDFIRAPLYFRIEDASSDFGEISLVPQIATYAAYLRIPPPPGGVPLAPGASTSPFHLTFGFHGEMHPSERRFVILKMKVRIFCPR